MSKYDPSKKRREKGCDLPRLKSSISRSKYDCHSWSIYCNFSSRDFVERDRRRKRWGNLRRTYDSGCLELKVHRTLWRTRYPVISRKSITWSSSCNTVRKTITSRLSFLRCHLSNFEKHWSHPVIGTWIVREEDCPDQKQISLERILWHTCRSVEFLPIFQISFYEFLSLGTDIGILEISQVQEGDCDPLMISMKIEFEIRSFTCPSLSYRRREGDPRSFRYINRRRSPSVTQIIRL